MNKETQRAYGINEYGFTNLPTKGTYLRIIKMEDSSLCPFCKMNRGENRKAWKSKSWKNYRKTQFRTVT